MPEAKKEVKELPVATIESLDSGKISLKIEIDGVENVFPFTTTEKVDQFLSNPKYSKDYHRGTVVEFSAHNGIVTLIRKAKGFTKATSKGLSQDPTFINLDKITKATMGLPENQQATTPKIVSMECVATTGGQVLPEPPKPLAVSPQVVAFPPKQTTGPFDPAKVHGYTIKDTCQMGAYEPLSIEVVADDPETARRALVDAWQIFGQHNEVIRETVQKHVERTLLRV